MYATVNCAIVTLIPKYTYDKTMKYMRHIACCITFYKIISKFLTFRLSKVINVVVDDNQSDFLPGKVIHDNIIMAYERVKGYNRKYISPRCAIQMDSKKAYDLVEWSTLEDIIQDMNFSRRFIKWIMICVTYFLQVLY